MGVYAFTHAHIRVCTNTHVCIFVYTRTHMSTCPREDTNTNVHMRTQMLMHIYETTICTDTSTRTSRHIFRKTEVHTYTRILTYIWTRQVSCTATCRHLDPVFLVCMQAGSVLRQEDRQGRAACLQVGRYAGTQVCMYVGMWLCRCRPVGLHVCWYVRS